MKAIFLARGPHFKTDLQMSEPIINLDIYPLIAHLLGIEPAPNNGSLARTLPFLQASANLVENNLSVNSAGRIEIITCIALLLLGLTHTFLLKQ